MQIQVAACQTANSSDLVLLVRTGSGSDWFPPRVNTLELKMASFNTILTKMLETNKLLGVKETIICSTKYLANLKYEILG